MSLQTLNDLMSEVKRLRAKAELRERCADRIDPALSIYDWIDWKTPFGVSFTNNTRNYEPEACSIIDKAFGEAIGPLQDAILTTMRTSLMAEAQRLRLQADALENRVNASILIVCTPTNEAKA